MEGDKSLEQKTHVIGAGRPKLSLRRKKDKDPIKRSSPKKKVRSEATLQTATPELTTKRDVCDNDSSTSTLKSTSARTTTDVLSLNEGGTRPFYKEGRGVEVGGELAEVETAGVHPTDDGLGDFFFCHICQKDLTVFNETRRQQHINRCCDKVEEEEKKSAESAATKEGKGTALSCLLCGKKLKSENAKMTHMKSCAKSKGVTSEQLLQLVRESREGTSSVEGEPSSSSEPQRGTEERIHTRKSKRLAMQSKNEQQSLQSVLSISRGDDDFTMPPPTGRPGRRGRKRKRNNLQEDYLEELEEDQLQLAIAMSASLDHDVAAAGVGGPTDTLQDRGRKKQKRKKTAVQEVPPLLTVTATQAQNILSRRADEILRCSETAPSGGFEGDDGEIPCTPAFQESELGTSKPPTRHVTACNDQRDSDEELFLLEEDREERELPELEDVVPVKGAGSIEDQSIKLNEEEPTQETTSDAMHTESNSAIDQKVADNILYIDTSKKSPPTADGDYTLSFCDDLGQVEYPTLWQLTCEDVDDIDNFYVPALASVLSPPKAEHTLCKVCQVEPCLALPLERHYRLSATPSECDDQLSPSRTKEIDNKVSLTRLGTDAGPASYMNDVIVCQLLSDMGALVGSSLLSDVQIQTQSGSTIPAHAVILAARCPKLRKVIEHSLSFPISLNFSEFDEKSVMLFLRYIYTGSMPTQTDGDSDLGQQFPLLFQKWYADDSEEGDDGVVPDEDALSRREGSSPLQNISDQSTVMYHTRGPGLSSPVVATSPKLQDGSPLSESRTMSLKCPFSPPKEDAPLMIDSNSSSDDIVQEDSESSLIVEDLPESRRIEIKRSADEDEEEGMDSESSLIIADLPGSRKTEIAEKEEEERMDFVSPSLEQSPVARRSGSGTESTDRFDLHDLISAGSSWLAERRDGDGSVRPDAMEITGRQSSRESSRPPSHISLSSYDSSELLCETPTLSLSPQGPERAEGGESSSCDLFSTSLSRCKPGSEDVHGRSGSETEVEVCDDDTDVRLEVETKENVGGVEIDSPGRHSGYSSSSVDIVASISPRLREEEERDSTKESSPAHSFTADYSPFYDHSLRAYEEDVPYSPSPLELEPDQLVTPVNERSVAMVPVSVDTVKRKPREFKTPADCRVELQTDDDITPMPDFKTMRTPYLKGQCARFGVKGMAKKKMIAKLHEIYEYTHPLVDEEGRVILEESLVMGGGTSTASRATKQGLSSRGGGSGRTGGRSREKVTEKKEVTAASVVMATQQASTVKQQVIDYVKSDLQLYQDILVYKPTELSLFHTKLKAAGITIAKEKLPDILDSLCITYTVPRQQRAATGKNARKKQ